eukprot:4794675-Amphidinium_carterae.1
MGARHGLVAPAEHELEVEEEREEGEEGTKKCRKRTHIDPDIKQYFLDHHDLKSKQGWSMMDSLRRARVVLP